MGVELTNKYSRVVEGYLGRFDFVRDICGSLRFGRKGAAAEA